MKAIAEINGMEKVYPEEIFDLEGLLLFVMKEEISEDELIVEVKTDGEVYSEQYGHQARRIDLGSIKRIEITTQTKKFLAQAFLKEAPTFFKHIESGFRVSAQLLRDPQNGGNGYDLLARSLDTLGSLKSHMDNVRYVLGKDSKGSVIEDFWTRFNSLADHITVSLEEMNPISIADLLEYRMLPLLTEWREKL